MSFVGRIARQGGILATLLVVLLGTTSFVFADWPQWRQDPLLGGKTTEEVSLPLTLGWQLENRYFFPPVVADEILYTTWSGSSNAGVTNGGVGAYDLETGQTLWERTDFLVAGGIAVSVM